MAAEYARIWPATPATGKGVNSSKFKDLTGGADGPRTRRGRLQISNLLIYKGGKSPRVP